MIHLYLVLRLLLNLFGEVQLLEPEQKIIVIDKIENFIYINESFEVKKRIYLNVGM